MRQGKPSCDRPRVSRELGRLESTRPSRQHDERRPADQDLSTSHIRPCVSRPAIRRSERSPPRVLSSSCDAIISSLFLRQQRVRRAQSQVAVVQCIVGAVVHPACALADPGGEANWREGDRCESQRWKCSGSRGRSCGAVTTKWQRLERATQRNERRKREERLERERGGTRRVEVNETCVLARCECSRY
ncbi:hypothetical protein AAT19DRAFT_13494 [Rhodotorula toruloides]|uniref:Uncharacterized protein n=1 Tax=Rhodotorula toruloides TaxID=5286 RepID=A0A2T0AEQ6_RHOTO|nr:hypothetical protein AAT19DRAFT_13494 [Rhodotorula toruloides]